MRIRLFCAADLHDETPPRVDESGVCAWLIAGDLYEGGEPTPRLSAWLRRRSVPVYLVQGNHDVGPFTASTMGRVHDITGKAVRIASQLLLAGVGWAGSSSECLPTEAEIGEVCKAASQEVRALRGPDDVLVLLSHYPPKFPETLGPEYDAPGVTYGRIRQLVEELDPVACVTGHVHHLEYTRHRIKDCLVAFVGQTGCVLDVDVHARRAESQLWLPMA